VPPSEPPPEELLLPPDPELDAEPELLPEPPLEPPLPLPPPLLLLPPSSPDAPPPDPLPHPAAEPSSTTSATQSVQRKSGLIMGSSRSNHYRAEPGVAPTCYGRWTMSSGRLLLTIPLAAALASTGCAPSIADGAQSVFSTSQLCPYEGITVRARPDLSPHAVLKDTPPPAGMNIDSVGGTYEISGCSKKLLFVCGRPVIGNGADPFSAGFSQQDDGPHLSLNTDYFAITRSLDTEGNRVANVVVCQPASQSVQ